MPSRSHTPFYYGWAVVAAAFTAHFMTSGSAFYVFNAFLEPLVRERGWSYTQINRSVMIGPAVGILSQLFYGTMVYKVGPRLIMSLGPIVSGSACVLLGRVTEIWQFYLCFVLLCLGNGAMNGIVATTAVNNWFVKKRGMALGFSTSGISVSGVVVPFAALLILERTDLAHAYQWLGCAIVLVCPLAWTVVRDNPEKYGLLPDGISPEAEAKPKAEGDNEDGDQAPPPSWEAVGAKFVNASQQWRLAGLLRTPAFWKVGLSYAMILAGVAGVMLQLKPRFVHLGFDDRVAMLMMAATALMGTFGKFFWGLLCDRIEPRKVVATLTACGGVGLSFMFLENSLPVLVLFILVYGFAMGGVMSTLPIIVADLFGRRSFASVAKFMPMFMVLQAVGLEAMGQSMDRTGSYNTAYLLFVALNAAAALLILSVRRPLLGARARS